MQPKTPDTLNENTGKSLKEIQKSESAGGAANSHSKVMRLFVDPHSDGLKTIGEAINKADTGGAIIRLAPGVYHENLVITKPNLRFEAAEKKQGDVIIIAQTKPAVFIDLQPNEKCIFYDIKFAHQGKDETEEKLKKIGGVGALMSEPQDKKIQSSDLYKELITTLLLDPTMNCIFFLVKGHMIIDNCYLNLGLLSKANKGTTPAIVLNPGSSATLYGVDIKGSKTTQTVGILSRNANLEMKKSVIHNHKAGGVLIESDKANKVKLLCNEIGWNETVGIHVIGEDADPHVNGNNIYQTEKGPGIKIGIANKALIFGNSIRLNTNGIEYLSAEPAIFRNKIEKNLNNGIYCGTYDKLRSDGIIQRNIITHNGKNGIHASGENNSVCIYDNDHIDLNRKAGIRIDEKAHIRVGRNGIYRNLTQGILIVDSASANIEKNVISENLKANIAFGGMNSVDTTILDNTIERGRAEGIYMINAGKAWIYNNLIQGNNDGIMCVTSFPEIKSNKIQYNKSNGITLMQDSGVKLINNTILKNLGIGLLVRDRSYGTIKLNTIEENQLDLIIENWHEEMRLIEKKNTIKGEMQVPSKYICTLYQAILNIES